jgi:hypothetical protein
MTPATFGAYTVNLEQITYAENATWHQTGDPTTPLLSGVWIHFVGGSVLRLVGAAAHAARQALLLPQA